MVLNRKDVQASVAACCKEIDAQRVRRSRSVESEKMTGKPNLT